MSADKRTVATDALETLGMIHFKPEARDAIHLAVDPVKAGSNLIVGEKIGILEGIAYPTGSLIFGVKVPYHGIVDPFLPRGPKKDESFWFVMAPRMVKSLRHVWEHPDFPEGK
jgi:hypothetical protein